MSEKSIVISFFDGRDLEEWTSFLVKLERV